MEPRVAVIGVGGIGKHHAKWFALEGAEVVAICASTPETAIIRQHELATMIGFSGRAYADVATMLREAQPDAVSVASPHHLHAPHTEAALSAGCHVLCEKPFVYDPSWSAAESLAIASALVDRAAGMKLVLAVMTQYLSLVPTLAKLGEVTVGPATGIWQFCMRMESKPGARDARYEDIVVDLGPHPLAVLQGLVPGATLVEDSLEIAIEEHRTKASFDCVSMSESDELGPASCNVCLVLGKSETPRREFEVNGIRVMYEGRTDDFGNYTAHLRVGEHEAQVEDPLRLTVRHFLARIAGRPSGPIAEGRPALAALAMLYRLLHHGSRSCALG